MSMSTSKIDRLNPRELATNPRAGLPAWYKYQDLIIAAFKQHPKPYIFQPNNMSPQSVVSKARDAVRGCLAFAYPLPDGVFLPDLLRWYSEVVFKCDTDHVYIGPPDAIKSVLNGTQTFRDSDLKYPTLDLEDIAAFETLLSRGRMKGPVLIQSPPNLTLLQPRTNVERISRPDGSLVLI